MDAKRTSEEGNRVPILVGVIGHRDLVPEEVPEIELKLKSTLKALVSQYKKTPILVVTSLAEGADFLGAKVATEMGLPLISLLPMGIEEYKTHFQDAGNAAKLDSYVASSMISHECTPLTGEAGTSDDKFARSGAAVMQYSHIVITLWDGVWTGFDSGTSFLVKHAIEGIPHRIIFELEGDYASPLDPISTASIRRIPVKRLCNLQIVEPEFPPEMTPGPEKYCEIEFNKNNTVAKLKLGETQRKMFQHFDNFNRDQKSFYPKKGRWADMSSYPPLVPHESMALLPPGLETLRERFAMADQLALHFQQKRHHLFLKFIIILAAVIAFFHQIISSEFELHTWLKLPQEWDNLPFLEKFVKLGEAWPYLIYGTLIFVGWLTVSIVRQRKWQQRYLDYRTIAEGARIQFFWLIGGIRFPAVNYFLRKQLEDLEWIRGVLRLWYLRAITDDGWIAEATPDQAKLIQDYWIRDQLAYCSKTSKKCQKKDKLLKVASAVLITVLFSTMLAKMGNLPKKPILNEQLTQFIKIEMSWRHLLTLIGALAGAVAIYVSSLRYFFNYQDLSKSHSQMAVLFSDGDKVYEPADGIQKDERNLLRELGRESLAEVGDWLLMNRKRKVKLPTGKPS